jgi:hypothetical protein
MFGARPTKCRGGANRRTRRSLTGSTCRRGSSFASSRAVTGAPALHPRTIARHLVAVLALAAAAATASSSAGQAASARTWLGRAAEMEGHLRSADVVGLEDIGTGVTRPRRAHLTPAAPFESLVWKPLPPGMRGGHYESYKSEIAAYELDKLLALNMVPPAIERRIESQAGAAIMWLEGTRSVKEMGGKVPSGPQFARPIRMMLMFDNLIGNPDRNAGNILIDGANSLILIDHSRAFIAKDDLPWKFERVDAQLWQTLRGLTSEQLTAAIGPWVDAGAIGAIMRRRARIVTAVEKLVASNGAAVTIIP